MAYVTESLGRYVTQAYAEGLTYYDADGNPRTRENPYGLNIQPGGGGLSDAERRALFGYLVASQNPAYVETVRAIRMPGSAWMLSGTDYDSVLSIPAAADRDESFASEIGQIAAPFAAAIGAAYLASGAFGSALAAGGDTVGASALDVFTAQDVAWGSSALESSGLSYSEFLQGLATPIQSPLQTPAAPSSSAPIPASEWAAAADAADAAQGAGMLQNAGITYGTVTGAPLTGANLLDKAGGVIRSLTGRLVSALTAPGKAPAAPITAAPAPVQGSGALLAGLAIVAGLALAK